MKPVQNQLSYLEESGLIALAKLIPGGFLLGGVLVLFGVWIGALARFPGRPVTGETEPVTVDS